MNIKPLDHDDTSGFEFAKEMLAGDQTAAVNFDRFMYSPETGFIIMEFLLCEEDQAQKHDITPFSSHPNRYWNKNKRKFLSLWHATLNLHGTLYLVNYAKAGTQYEDQILLIKVLGMNQFCISNEEQRKYTRSKFQEWFKDINNKCLAPENTILAKDPIYVRNNYYHDDINCEFLRGKIDYSIFDKANTEYWSDCCPCKYCNRDRFEGENK